MGIIQVIFGCLIGVAVFKLMSLITTIADQGLWSTGILVAFCLIAVYILGFVPQWWASRRKTP